MTEERLVSKLYQLKEKRVEILHRNIKRAMRMRVKLCSVARALTTANACRGAAVRHLGSEGLTRATWQEGSAVRIPSCVSILGCSTAAVCSPACIFFSSLLLPSVAANTLSLFSKIYLNWVLRDQNSENFLGEAL